MKVEFSPSLMCMDFLKMEEQFNILNDKVDMYHIDIMDGHFCKNITLSPDLVKTFSKVAKKPMDVHLMTTNPTDWIEKVAEAGAEYISPHAETINGDAFRVMNMIKSLGCKTGVVLNPATPLSYVKHYLNRIDLLTIMTVDVGFAGQPFIPQSLDKIRQAKQWKEEKGYTYEIAADGCCNEKYYKDLYDAGCEVFIVGTSGLFGKSKDTREALAITEKLINEAIGE